MKKEKRKTVPGNTDAEAFQDPSSPIPGFQFQFPSFFLLVNFALFLNHQKSLSLNVSRKHLSQRLLPSLLPSLPSFLLSFLPSFRPPVLLPFHPSRFLFDFAFLSTISFLLLSFYSLSLSLSLSLSPTLLLLFLSISPFPPFLALSCYSFLPSFLLPFSLFLFN